MGLCALNVESRGGPILTRATSCGITFQGLGFVPGGRTGRDAAFDQRRGVESRVRTQIVNLGGMTWHIEV